MPLLEAMVNGCPVICSAASCFPEICADAAVYFDPDDSESIRTALESTLGSPDQLRDLATRAARRAAQFSWQRCAAETAAVYRALV
jgi:glycosyltransferase involved in cell wall biosynthesis